MSNVLQKPAKPSRRERGGTKPSSHTHPSNERLKTIVRRLPPNLPEQAFWDSVRPWVSDDTVSWKLYCPGKVRKRLNKENLASRAYIAFKSEGTVATFSREYDGHVFRDKAGNESQAVVEFAPYQKIPSEKKKADVRIGTIEQDEAYISFVESLNAAAESATAKPPSMEALLAATRPPSPPKTTPLLEALKADKEKEAILRNHAHYKDKDASAYSKKGGDPLGSGKKGTRGRHAPPPEAEKKTGPPSKKQAASSSTGSKTPAQPAPPAKPPRSRANKHRTAPSSSSVDASASSLSANPSDPASLILPPAAAAPSPPPVSEQPAVPARRAGQRPTLGLSSRQFEAALSGAVGEGSRRRRGAGGVSQSTSASASAESPAKPVAKEPGSVAVGSASSAAGSPVAGSPPAKVPGIIPRDVAATGGNERTRVRGGRNKGGRGRGGTPTARSGAA